MTGQRGTVWPIHPFEPWLYDLSRTREEVEACARPRTATSAQVYTLLLVKRHNRRLARPALYKPPTKKTAPAQFTLLALGKCIIPWACSASAVKPCNELLICECWLQAQTWPRPTKRRNRRDDETDGATRPTERRDRRNDEIDGTAIQTERQGRRKVGTVRTTRTMERRDRPNDERDRRKDEID